MQTNTTTVARHLNKCQANNPATCEGMEMSILTLSTHHQAIKQVRISGTKKRNAGYNPAIAARVVHPNPAVAQKVSTAYRGVTYQIKAHEMSFQTQKKSFCCDRYVCVGKTLKLDTCSKFWGNFEGIWGNPGDIPHTGSNFSGV